MLYPLSEDLAQVRTVALDGSPGWGASGQASAVPLRGRLRYLVSSPVEEEALYAVSVSPPRVVDGSGAEHSANLDQRAVSHTHLRRLSPPQPRGARDAGPGFRGLLGGWVT